MKAKANPTYLQNQLKEFKRFIKSQMSKNEVMATDGMDLG